MNIYNYLCFLLIDWVILEISNTYCLVLENLTQFSSKFSFMQNLNRTDEEQKIRTK